MSYNHELEIDEVWNRIYDLGSIMGCHSGLLSRDFKCACFYGQSIGNYLTEFVWCLMTVRFFFMFWCLLKNVLKRFVMSFNLVQKLFYWKIRKILRLLNPLKSSILFWDSIHLFLKSFFVNYIIFEIDKYLTCIYSTEKI